jgi:putative membrane protein
VLATLSRAGWGLPFVALFHLLPLMIDAAAIVLLFKGDCTRKSAQDGLLARWVGESANSLMPAGQLGGPVLMARFLTRRGMAVEESAAAITVNTTLQTFAQIMFALVGALLLGVEASHLTALALRTSALVASGFLGLQVCGFYWLQRRGIFGKLIVTAARFWGTRDWSTMMTQAQAIDRQVEDIYHRGSAVAGCLSLNLAGWFVGVGEVYLIAWLLGTPVSWSHALVLESVGQAIRGAGFAIPGALGLQEGGYLLLAPLAGLPPNAGVALSLAKRSRELLLGLPGLVYLHFSGRSATR